MRTTIGKEDRERPVASSSRSPRPKMRMISGARSIRSPVSAPRTMSTSQKSVEATRQARARCSFSSSSLNTGTKAAPSAASAASARTRFGTWKATVNALIVALDAEGAARDDLAQETEDARDSGDGRGENRGRPGEPPPRPVRTFAASPPRVHPGEDRRAARARGRLLRFPPAQRGLFLGMPNIKQQKRRVSIAARQRLENLRHRSTREDSVQAAGDGGRRRRQGRRRRRPTGSSCAASTGRPQPARCTRIEPRGRSLRPHAWSPARRSLSHLRRVL